MYAFGSFHCQISPRGLARVVTGQVSLIAVQLIHLTFPLMIKCQCQTKAVWIQLLTAQRHCLTSTPFIEEHIVIPPSDARITRSFEYHNMLEEDASHNETYFQPKYKWYRGQEVLHFPTQLLVKEKRCIALSSESKWDLRKVRWLIKIFAYIPACRLGCFWDSCLASYQVTRASFPWRKISI